MNEAISMMTKKILTMEITMKIGKTDIHPGMNLDMITHIAM